MSEKNEDVNIALLQTRAVQGYGDKHVDSFEVWNRHIGTNLFF